eukprot:TRINITY_DN4792_c0_g1_i1.p1 TRINITY_DN4792_c0_g1~~TRINITY_DN4792_c0_g1_i1.p1  ORF type:complete len:207 (+),score=32.87 TRINITY_DN4792_c0_g1_i1:116-736(+)
MADDMSIRSRRSRGSNRSMGSRASSMGQLSHQSISSSVASSAARDDYMRVPPRARRVYNSSNGGLPEVGRFALNNTVGYTGFIPGKAAENIHGGTYRVVNERAATEVDLLRAGVRLTAPTRAPGPVYGTEIPGYTGFVPGRYSDNVLGMSNPRGAEMAWLLKAQQADERRMRTSSYRDGVRPPTGFQDHSGYRPHGGMSGVDSRFE